MRTFVYAARFAPGDEGGVVVIFPDVAQAITQGDNVADAITQAQVALGLALLPDPRRDRRLPHARAEGGGLSAIAAEPEIAAKIAVREAIKRCSAGKCELGRGIGEEQQEIRRILDPRHRTQPGTEPFRPLGRQFVIGVQEAA